MSQQPLLASQLFCKSQGVQMTGDQRCHYCCGPCERERWRHDDPPPVPFVRTVSTAKCPSEPWVCYGCWLYRRTRATVKTLQGFIKDGKSLSRFDWWMTEEDCWIVEKGDKDLIYNLLLKPPLVFSFAFKDGSVSENLIQLAIVNKFELICADTPLEFTFNNIPSYYTIYELEEGLKNGVEGRLPGVGLLIKHLGAFSLPKEVEERREKRGRGRPPKNKEEDESKNPKRIVTQSLSRSN